MYLSKDEILEKFEKWLLAWDSYDLNGVMDLIHEKIEFENWDESIIKGKVTLRKVWFLWFLNHGNFKFYNEDIFIDEKEQKLLFRWILEWPSLEKEFRGKKEIRKGVDVIQFLDGKIISKYSYSKTKIQIDSNFIYLQAYKSYSE
jgi:hypothetical protein